MTIGESSPIHPSNNSEGLACPRWISERRAAILQFMSLLASSEMQTLISKIHGDGCFRRILYDFPDFVLSLAGHLKQPRILEVGGGRSPMLSQDQVAALDARYTVNDISARELEQAPKWVSRLHGDIADAGLLQGAESGKYDLIFSRMVFEHVRDPKQAYANIASLLSVGGVAVNAIPTLYASPFLLNRMLPQGLSARLLKRFDPKRNPEEVPKFPAYYRWCTSTEATRRKLEKVGFQTAQLVPFYGHDYYSGFPVLRDLVIGARQLAASRDWRPLSTYALVIVEI